MSYHDESYDERRQREREEQRQYEGDVMYQVWRNGGNPDNINYDRVNEHHMYGDDCDTAAAHELRIQRQHRQQPDEYQEPDPQYPPDEPKD